jgi:transposase
LNDGYLAVFSAFARLRPKRLLNEGKLVSEIAETFGVHVATIYRLGAAQ